MVAKLDRLARSMLDFTAVMATATKESWVDLVSWRLERWGPWASRKDSECHVHDPHTPISYGGSATLATRGLGGQRTSALTQVLATLAMWRSPRL